MLTMLENLIHNPGDVQNKHGIKSPSCNKVKDPQPPLSSTSSDSTRVTRVFARAEPLETDSNGCVVCPPSVPEGPDCGPGEERLLRAPTCRQCPEYYCGPVENNRSPGPNIGGIVGGVVGGVVVLIGGCLLYYFLIWKKKHPLLDEEEDIILSDFEADESKENLTSENSEDKRASSGTLERPVRKGVPANRRLSSYESFTRPQAKFRNQRRRPQKRLKSRNLIQNSQGPYLDPNSSNRNSVATTISTTNASNILPIAYIPGVTVRPTKNNTKSIYSYETDSIFSDLNTIENASIIGDIMRANYNGQDNGSNDNNMTTAIKAQPRLVNVDRIEEEDEDEEYDDEIDGIEEADVSSNEESKHDSKTSVITTTKHVNDSTLSNIIIEDDSDSDSDVDSDIGEIHRATSVRRNEAQVQVVNKEIPLDLIDLGKPGLNDQATTASTEAGSFVLDVEIDDNRQSQTSGERSPFEDP